nr:MAG TPA: hypothetical protein [Caudoviricetes sp.]
MILYSQGCVKCDVLKKKLEQKGLSFKIESNDFSKIIAVGIDFMPVLELDNGELLQFNDAVKYINNL